MSDSPEDFFEWEPIKMNDSINRYIVVFLIECEDIDAPEIAPLYEESIYLVKANSEEEAESLAQIQVEPPLSYKNIYGETLIWRLLETIEVVELGAAAGTNIEEVYYRHFESLQDYETVAKWTAPDDDE